MASLDHVDLLGIAASIRRDRRRDHPLTEALYRCVSRLRSNPHHESFASHEGDSLEEVSSRGPREALHRFFDGVEA